MRRMQMQPAKDSCCRTRAHSAVTTSLQEHRLGQTTGRLTVLGSCGLAQPQPQPHPLQGRWRLPALLLLLRAVGAAAPL